MNRILDLRQFTEATQKRNVLNLLSILQDGESFTLLDAADPKNLLESLPVNAPQNLQLEYLESGPSLWRLRLTKLNEVPNQEGCCGCCGG